ncbi:MAG TPA: LysR substrate-binding domain-containing protein [Candidimonas sp.]|nr:LysR substrate-binding domain-containing protein [Candidimonas sp.]
MELRHLRYFVAVAQELHFSRAAEKLGISPPTLTVQIQEIERHIGAQLFSRTKRQVALTAAGIAFLDEARRTIGQFEQALHVGRRAGRGELGRIELGYVGSAVFSGVLQHHMRLFRQSYPGVSLDARELPMEHLPELVENGQVDVAVLRLPVDLPVSLRTQVLLRDCYCLAVPSEHALASLPMDIKPQLLAGEIFIIPEQDLGTREVARRGGFMPRVGAAPGSLLAVLTQVSLGAGVAVVPTALNGVVALPNVAFKTLAGTPIASEVAAVFRHTESAPAVLHLIEQLKQPGPPQTFHCVLSGG